MRIKPNDMIKCYKIIEVARGGGHGDLCFAVDSSGNDVALKFMKEKDVTNEIAFKRFRYEVESQTKMMAFSNVLPVLDSHLPVKGSKVDLPWFAMPKAQVMKQDMFTAASFREIVDAIFDIAQTLNAIHDHQYSHRDIKPENIFLYNGKWTLGDFGLVDFPEKEAISGNQKKIGPLYYIAPEMLNHPETADGNKADVYSLAKVFWKIVSGFQYPIPGIHQCNIPAMTLSNYTDDSRAHLLDGLLDRCTQLDPNNRPTANAICTELGLWLNPRIHKMKRNTIPDFNGLKVAISDRNIANELKTASLSVEMDFLGDIVSKKSMQIAEDYVKDTGLWHVFGCGGINPIEQNQEYLKHDYMKQISRRGIGFGLWVEGNKHQDRIQVEILASQIEKTIFLSGAVWICDNGTNTPKNPIQLYINHINFVATKTNVEDNIEILFSNIIDAIDYGLPQLKNRIENRIKTQEI